MIPTINVNGANKDFNPMDKDTYKGFNNAVNSKSNNIIMSVSDSNLNITAQNHGTLYPPGPPAGIGF